MHLGRLCRAAYLAQRRGEHDLVVEYVLLELGGGLDGGAAAQGGARDARRHPLVQRLEVCHLHQRIQRRAPERGCSVDQSALAA